MCIEFEKVLSCKGWGMENFLYSKRTDIVGKLEFPLPNIVEEVRSLLTGVQLIN